MKAEIFIHVPAFEGSRKVVITYSTREVGAGSLYKIIAAQDKVTGTVLDVAPLEGWNEPAVIDQLIAKATQGDFAMRELGINLQKELVIRKKPKPKPRLSTDGPELPMTFHNPAKQ